MMGSTWEELYKRAIQTIASWPGYYEELMAPDICDFAAEIAAATTEAAAELILDQHDEDFRDEKELNEAVQEFYYFDKL